MRNPDKLLSNPQYSDAVAEVKEEAAGYDFPPSTRRMRKRMREETSILILMARG